MFKNKLLLNEIFISNHSGDKYIIFNHEDKTWVLPAYKIKAALNMYQPTTFKGKLLKRLVFCCGKIPFIASKIGVRYLTLSVKEDVFKYIKDTVGSEHFYIAGYMGDTSSEQNNKVTLQIYDDIHLIGYAKITKDVKIMGNFKCEIDALRFLECKGIKNIPQIFGDNNIEGMNIFLQTTKKEVQEKVCLKFGEQQIKFIDNIVKATKRELSYEETDFFRSVRYLKTRLGDFDEYEKRILKESIKIVEKKLLEKRCEYCFFHGDYTPWNVYYKDETLNAFDFEYCSYTMPKYIDIFHYLTQMSLLGMKNNIRRTICLYKKNKRLLEKYISNTDFTYLCYLVYIVSFYKKRTKKKDKEVNKKYEKWIGIMAYLEKQWE